MLQDLAREQRPVTTMRELAYTISRDPRSKHVRLKMSAREGLVVVAPKSVSEHDIQRFVESKREWVERNYARIAPRREAYKRLAEGELPARIDLRALGETYPVFYEQTEATATSARFRDGVLVVSGPDITPDASVAALCRAVDRIAKNDLVGLLHVSVREHGLVAPVSVRIGAPRSRWGSCSSSKTISLSRNLLFLPAELAHHVILHELAHMKHPDHSARFYAYLKALDPEADAHKRALKDATRYVPVWADR